MAAVTVVIVLGTIIYTLQMTPVYTATASVVLDVRKHDVVNEAEVLSQLPNESSVVDTEVEVIRSHAMAERVTRLLGLDQDPEFYVADPTAAPDPDLWNVVAQRVSRHLKVARIGTTYLIEVSFISRDPGKAAKIANAFANEYMASQLRAKSDATQHANLWLKSQLDDLQQQVLQTDAAVQTYKIQHNLLGANSLNGPQAGGPTLNEQEATNMYKSLADARADVSEKEARYAAAQEMKKSGGSGEDTAEALASPAVQSLRVDIAKASQNIADLKGKLGPDHPTLKNAISQYDALQDLLARELSRIQSSLKTQMEVSRARLKALEDTARASRDELANNNQATVLLKQLEQKADSARQMYSSYLNRYLETASQQGIQQADARIASEATVPSSPSAPRKTLCAGFGLLVGLLVAGVAAFAAEALDSSLATAEDVERTFDLPLLGSIASLTSTFASKRRPSTRQISEELRRTRNMGRLRAELHAFGRLVKWLFLAIFTHPAPNRGRISPADYIVKRPFSSFSEGFRNLRASLKLAHSGGPGRVIALTSSLPGEGKTTTALCLARVLGLAGSSVIVVDCDLRRRGVRQVLKNDPEVGLIEVLNGTATTGEAIVSDRVMGVFYLPLAKTASTPRDVFGASAMGKLLDELRSAFDVVLLDCPPVLAVADTSIVAPQADTALLLAQWRKTPRKAIERSMRVLTSVGAPVAGIVLTQVDQRRQAREGYGDSGYYFSEYKHYYQA